MTSERIQLGDLLEGVKPYEPHLMRALMNPGDLLPENQILDAAAKTAQDILARQGLKDIEITDADRQKTEELFENLTQNNQPPAASQIQTSAVALKLKAFVSDYDHQVVKHAEQIRLLVTNKLLELADHRDGRIQLKAVELLGKIADVGMFVEKQEITYKQQSYEELELKLKEKLGLLIEGEIVGDEVVTPAELKKVAQPVDVLPLPDLPEVTSNTIQYYLNENNA